MSDEKLLPQNGKKTTKPKQVKIKRDNLNYPTFDKVTVNDRKRPHYNHADVLTNAYDPDKSLPEIELFSHHNFNLLRFPPMPDDGVYGGEPMVSYRTTFGVNLEGHDLYRAVSSIIVYAGFWKIYAGDTLVATLGPGHYKEVSEDGIPNDSITRIESTHF